MSSSERPKSAPPDDVIGSEAGLDIRRRREPEMLLVSRDLRRHRLDVSRKPISSTARNYHSIVTSAADLLNIISKFCLFVCPHLRVAPTSFY